MKNKSHAKKVRSTSEVLRSTFQRFSPYFSRRNITSKLKLPHFSQFTFLRRARKLDWSKIEFEGCSASECQQTWGYIQERIRRFRILAEMIPDARTWIAHPWTNFYKSKDHNRHPDMPKKPLSMYMLFYSEMREEILKTNPSMSMPEVAKACSEKYQKLSDKKKAKYKARCDEKRRMYDEKMRQFYIDHPDLKPVKPEKKKGGGGGSNTAAAQAAALAAAQQMALQQQQQQMQQNVMIQPQQQQQQPMVATLTANLAGSQPLQMEMPLGPIPTQPQQQQQPIQIKASVARFATVIQLKIYLTFTFSVFNVLENEQIGSF